jgi:hypothetical protein
MGKQNRIYNKTYSVPIILTDGANFNASTPIYFTGYHFLNDKTVKAITISPIERGNPLFYPYPRMYLTLQDTKGQQILYNYPVPDLIITSKQNTTLNLESRMRLFKLPNVDLNNSYFMITTNAFVLVYGTVANINFHY